MEPNKLITIEKKIINPKNDEDLICLKNFILNNPIGTTTFRYFSTREFSIVENHLYTCLYLKDNNILGYGHLDFENDTIWLGIFVGDSYQSNGYGSFIMDDLINQTNKQIFLSVDKNNMGAVKLYKKKGFEIIEETNKQYIMNKKMADTLGTLIDKLTTVDLKMWNNQELLYEIRRMTFDDFTEKYFKSEDGSKKIWEILKKACDLNVQRNQLINEVDEKVIEIINAKLNNEDLDNGKFLQRSHKTY